MGAAVGQVHPGNHLVQGLTVFSTTVSDTKGFMQISEFAIATISFLGKALAELPVGATEFAKHLKSGVHVLVVVNLINDLKWWFCDARQSWQHTAHKATLIVLETLQTAVFLDAIKVINLSKISTKIGNVPVIGLAASLLTSGTTLFSLWHHGRKIVVLSRNINALMFRIHTENPPDAELPNLRATLAATYVERTKAKISVLSDISTIAFCVLGLVGVASGVAILAMNSWLMLVLGLVVAGIGVYDIAYGKAHPAPAPAA
jgi:hypothetical protein